MTPIEEFIQALSNNASSAVSAPVDIANWLMKKGGLPVSQTPIGGSDWMAQNGLTKETSGGLATTMADLSAIASPVGFGAISKVASKAKKALNNSGVFGKMEASAASKSPRMLDPKPTPQRPFHDDYPQGIAGPDGGRLALDIDGNPISPTSLIAGRRVGGGMDEGLSRVDQDRIAGALGINVGAAPASKIGGNAGIYSRDSGIFVDQSLDPTQINRVLSHELGHALDDRATAILGAGGSKIPTTGIKKQLAFIYENLNTPGWFKPGRGNTPASQGYKPKDADGELTAEAIRFYMTDPNAMKTNFPDVAKRIREYVNRNPNLKDVVQFNSAAGLGLLGYEEDR